MAFVGRTTELEAVAGALARAATGSSVLVAVEGEAGIGKSALVDEAVARWSRGPGRREVLRGKADELGSSSPFGVLRGLLGRAGIVPPGGDEGEVADDRLASGLVGAVEELTSTAAVVLVVDDAQWSDPASLRVLGRALDELHDRSLAVVVVLRPSPRRRELAELFTVAPDVCGLVLAPLATDDLADVVRAHGQPVDADRLPLEQVGGNPFYALELARAVLRESDPAATFAPPLTVTILRRIGYLGTATLDVLRAGTLLGGRFTVEQLVLATEERPPVVVAAVGEAVDAGVLLSTDRHLVFAHDLVRSALYDDQPEAVRRYRHGRLGRTLAAQGAEASVVARQLELGAVEGDVVAARWLARAAAEAAPRSVAAAIDFLQRALALAPPEPLRAELAASLATQLGFAGRHAEVLGLAEAELRRSPPTALAVPLTITLANALTGQNRAAEASARLVALAHRLPPSAERGRVVSMLASTRLTQGDAAGAGAAAGEALDLLDHVGDRHWVSQALAMQAWLAAGAGDPVGAVRRGEEAFAACPPDDPSAAGFCRLALAAALLDADRLDEARAVALLAIERAEASSAVVNVALLHTALALGSYWAGRLDDAAAEAEAALATSEERGARIGDAYASAVLGRVALHRGDVAAAEAALAPAEERLARSGPVLGAELVLWVRALLDEQGGGEPAIELLELAWQVHPLRHLLSWRAIAPDLVRWATAAGRVELAASVVAAAEEVAARSGVAGIAATAGRCRALLTGQPDDAVAALELARRGARLIDLGPALVGAAVVAPGRSCTVELLREAAAVLEGVGALADVAGVGDVARRRGIRLEAPSRPGGRPGGVLTAAERSVAALAASGLTNRAIGARLAMSRHTVDTHLRRVYAKLAVSGRVELARRWPDGTTS